eukprot:766547-Hanusia_phi.AAC.5
MSCCRIKPVGDINRNTSSLPPSPPHLTLTLAHPAEERAAERQVGRGEGARERKTRRGKGASKLGYKADRPDSLLLSSADPLPPPGVPCPLLTPQSSSRRAHRCGRSGCSEAPGLQSAAPPAAAAPPLHLRHLPPSRLPPAPDTSDGMRMAAEKEIASCTVTVGSSTS